MENKLLADASNGYLMHLHADELVASAAMLWTGTGLIAGLDTAKPIFATRVEKHPESWWRDQKQICLGGGGDFSDEHRNGAAERIRGTSACKIMSERLRITDPDFLKIVEEVNHYDSHIGCPKSHLASIIKMAKLKSPGGDMVNYRWFMRLIKAVYRKMNKQLQPTRREVSFGRFAKRIMNSRSSFSDELARQGLVDLIEKENESAEPLVLSARHIYESLWRTSPGETVDDKLESIGDDVLSLLDVMYWDQINFHGFKTFVMSQDFDGQFWVNVWDGQEMKRTKACIVSTDNPQAHSAMRSSGAGLTIVRSLKGNVTIQGNIKVAQERKLMTAMDLGVRNFIAMNRFLDLPPQERPTAYWELMEVRGNCPKDDKWYLGDEDWLAGYNGTQNHESPPTKISNLRLRQNAQVAFDPKAVDHWKGVNDVPVSWLKPVKSVESWLKPVSLEGDLDKAFR